jgi:hypothetical protein
VGRGRGDKGAFSPRLHFFALFRTSLNSFAHNSHTKSIDSHTFLCYTVAVPVETTLLQPSSQPQFVEESVGGVAAGFAATQRLPEMPLLQVEGERAGFRASTQPTHSRFTFDSQRFV